MYQTNGATYPDDFETMRDLTLSLYLSVQTRPTRQVDPPLYLIVYWITVPLQVRPRVVWGNWSNRIRPDENGLVSADSCHQPALAGPDDGLGTVVRAYLRVGVRQVVAGRAL